LALFQVWPCLQQVVQLEWKPVLLERQELLEERRPLAVQQALVGPVFPA
jgi:hypothetical protein